MIFDLSIIIVNWKTKDLLRVCLGSIYEQTCNLDYEILVVDNASGDGSVEMLQKEFPLVRLIVNRENVGFARANNQAIRESKGRYILLLNPDTQILDHAIEKMVDFMIENKEIGILGPKILGKDSSLQISCYRFDSLSSLFSTYIFFNKLGQGYSYKNFDFNCVKEVDVVTGACLLTKKDVIKDIGLLDEDFFMYSEEADWCFRAKKRGWKVVYYPSAKITHLGGASSEQIWGKMVLEAHHSQTKFVEKHYSKTKIKVMKIIIFIGIVLRLVILYFIKILKSTPGNRIRFQKYLTIFKCYLKQ